MPARTLNRKRALVGASAKPPTRAVLYARVSSKEQEQGGYSLDAQQVLVRDYASRNHLVIEREFIDVESARASGRAQFGEMLVYLKKHRTTCPIVLVEKTDRLYRNFKDLTTLDDLGVTIHLVKEGRIIGPDSGSSDHLVHGFNVLIARNYVLNLAEETRKGMTEKARSGTYPSCAPVGYRNIEGPRSKRIIIPDPDTAPVITELFARFATGAYSIKRLAAEFRSEGRSLAGRKVGGSLLHQILRKRLYTGAEFDWNGKTYASTHEALVTRECWDRVQALLDQRAENRTRKVKHDFAFTGLVTCGHCGCLMVGEIKKGLYVYYHCTGNRGKCPEPFTRQEVLMDRFASTLRGLVIPRQILDWLGEAILESDRTEQAARESAVKRLRAQCERIRSRTETMYMDKLEGRIDQELFDRYSATLRDEQDVLMRKIQEIQNAALVPIDQAIDMMRLTSNASELFQQQSATEQRRFLRVVVEKASWQNGGLRTTLFEPFEILRHSNQRSHRKDNELGAATPDIEDWLLR